MGGPQYPWVPLAIAEHSYHSGRGDILSYTLHFLVTAVLWLPELIGGKPWDGFWETIQKTTMSEIEAFREV